MVFEQIEQLQRQYTDKYVTVVGSRPELARFNDLVGQVKTVNMNGRALVEFLDYDANTGWYDIGLDYLKFVPAPDPNAKKAEKPAKAPPAKPATAKAATAEKPAAKPAAAKSSTADILAAARAKGASGAASPTAKPATAATGSAATKPAGGKPSTADILAAARAKAAPPPPPPQTDSPEPDPQPAAPVAPSAAQVPSAKPANKPATGGGPLPTNTADKIAYCRRVDAKG
ncbi:MAG: hypothetical protein SFX18_13625 [Pirellulales bacterium]|nr:hypothetical protein [Pirellulales bacterium]